MGQSFTARVKANLNATALAGNCLAMAQSIVGAPVNYPSATVAANATKYRHASRTMPNSIAVAWFDHWGSYGEPGREVRANWGHVVVWVPGRGFASSSPVPGEVSRPYFYSSLGEVERAFSCSFRFWSEDLNGLRVTAPTAAPIESPEEDDVIFIRKNSAGTVYAWSAASGKKRALKTVEWDAIQRAYGRGKQPVPVVELSTAEIKHFGI